MHNAKTTHSIFWALSGWNVHAKWADIKIEISKKC